MKILGAGDAIFQRRLSALGNDSLQELGSVLASVDGAYVNFEMVTPTLPAVPSAKTIAMRVAAPAWTVDELQWLGFNLFGLASNHVDDFGLVGLGETMDVMSRRGVTWAGSGTNLERARRPAYLDTSSGRVALLCATSSGAELSLASDGLGVIGARSGSNPLRFRTEYRLTPDLFEQLKRIDSALGSAETAKFLAGLGMFPGSSAPPDGTLYSFAGRRFVRSEKSGIDTRPHPADLAGISRWISEARETADVVIVALHSHEGAADGWNTDRPAQFLQEAARKFVDGGADVIFGHGPHRLRGLEIYNGRPIFYSLGNFLFQDETFQVMGSETYDMFGLASDSVPSDFHRWRSRWPDGALKGFHSHIEYWDSVVAVCDFGDSGCRSIILIPIHLQRDDVSLVRGLPRLADPAEGSRILRSLQGMSESYGTKIAIVPSPNGLLRGEVAVG